MKRFGKAAPHAPAPNAAPAPGPAIVNMKPVDVPVDKLAAPVAVPAPSPDADPVHIVAPEDVTTEGGKGGSKLNKFLKKNAPKPSGGRRFLKGFRRGDDKPAVIAAQPDVTYLPDEAPVDPSTNNSNEDPAVSEKKKLKAERHAAQMADYEERLNEWNAELKRKQNQNELMDLPFDPDTEMRPKPNPPPPLEDSDTEQVDEPSAPSDNNMHKRVSSFRPIDTPVVVEGQKAKPSEIAEMFAAKAYGGAPLQQQQAHPVPPTHINTNPANPTSISMASMFSVAGPILPPGASMQAELPPMQQAMQYAAPVPVLPPQPGMTAQYVHAPPANAYQPVPQAFAPHAPQTQYAAPAPAGIINMAHIPQVQSATYVDPGLAEKIRRGREMSKLGISAEESGNMGSAKEAYMKALELLIPAIPLLDHGNDVSYTFRMSEKRKLNREAALMLDRCEEIKKFLDGEVAALNTRNLLESAPAPNIMPRQIPKNNIKTTDVDATRYYDGESEGGSGDVGLAKRPVQKKKINNNDIIKAPKAPPPPPSNLLDGFSSMSLADQPAPLPAPLPKSTLHRNSNSNNNTGPIDDDILRQQAISRPPHLHPGGIPPSPPAFPETPPGLHQNSNNNNNQGGPGF